MTYNLHISLYNNWPGGLREKEYVQAKKKTNDNKIMLIISPFSEQYA